MDTEEEIRVVVRRDCVLTVPKTLAVHLVRRGHAEYEDGAAPQEPESRTFQSVDDSPLEEVTDDG